MNSFCNQIDLLSLRSHTSGRDAVERIFFGDIDSKGAIARDDLMVKGPKALTVGQRCDFARLLLSLEARRKVSVEKLRKDGQKFLANELDADPDIFRAMNETGLDNSPSNFVENQLGWCLEDHAVTLIQNLVDNPEVGGRLINAHWAVKRIAQQDGSLILSDRPLIRVHGYDRPGATWVLPLDPYAAFIACNDQNNLTKLIRLSGQRFVKATNTSSAAQAERFVFCADQAHGRWLGKYLKPRS